ncbi:MAG TPA: glycoside-pentoside-hexuronide (GPH):cation symporter [Candidatus Limiplasma sp.]|nr:glycoside-pentoside-hexuronide (GPH):cation symporter [Candidatus Limiplasma sp.]HPS82139.1 glycoside-pentoside-hexuronide (GPH):cation symporter [Candidatus Limiplasma sp.]
MEKNYDRRNHYCFGLGTIGRDMFYTMVSMYIMVYITEVLNVPDSTLAVMTLLLLVLRCFDAFNDPIMGLVVDNTHSRFGKFKPWMLVGALVGGVSMVLMFLDMGLTGGAYAAVFALCYLMWDVFYGLNDIAYWSMMPSLSTDQKQREKIGSFARICANIGLFSVVVGVIPATNALTAATGSARQGWFLFAVIVALIMLGFQMITLFGVKERKGYFKEEEKTTLREMFRVLFQNDQLLWVAISMSLFMIGYCTTTAFGVYFFKYAYRDENMYSIFALVLGVSQLTALAAFTSVRKLFNRRTLYTVATGLVIAGYILFYFAPMNMAYIGVAGVLIFVGQAFIQMLMLMFLSDSIEYGQWKLGKRNESVTFSVQPFINKIGGALANGVLGLTLIVSGINAAPTPADVTPQGITVMKLSMMILPLISIVAGYVVYMRKFKIDEKRYAELLADLKARGDIDKGIAEGEPQAENVAL